MAWVGIEWVQAYGGTANLSNTKAQAEGFYNTISGVRRFNFGDSLAWDQDFEQQGRTFNTVGIALSAVGGAALAAGAALMVTDVVRRRAAERGADAPATPTTPKLKPGQKTRKVRKVIEVEEPATSWLIAPVVSPGTIGVVSLFNY